MTLWNIRIFEDEDDEHEDESSISNRSSGWNDSTFWDDDNPVSNVIIFAIDVARFTFGLYYDPVPNTDVFIDNGTFDNAMSSDAERGTV